MLAKNLTPMLFGAKAGARRPPRVEMTAVVRGKFAIRPGEPVALLEGPLEQGHLTDEVFPEDDEDLLGPTTYPGDFADFKPSAEILCVGHCHTPGGKPLPECPVVIGVGTWQKALRVVGRRVFTEKILGPAATDPVPFTRMAIGWQNAFGGSGYTKNPVGKGHGTDELPNVLHPRDLIDSRRERLEPAGFGPIPSTWAARAERRGKAYGRSWKESRAPFHSEDFDYRHFNAAPPDQWLEGYLRGDEPLLFQNLHPVHPVLRTRLPSLRVRLLVKSAGGEIHEATAVLDTLFADLDEGTITLTWRALFPAGEDDLSDVRSVLVWSEPLGEAPAPTHEKMALLEAFERDPVGLGERAPPGFTDLVERYERERRGEPIQDDEEALAKLDPVSRLMRKKLGRFALEEQAQVAEGMRRAAAGAGPKVDLDAEAAKMVQKLEDTPPVPLIRKPGVMPNTGLRRQMRVILDEAAVLRKTLADRELSPEQRREIERKLEELAAIPRDPLWARLDPTYVPPEAPLSTDEPGPGRDLAEHDLTGRDLSGMDLSGANLEHALLTRVNLSGANLRGANLKNAILFRANLDGADLAGAELTRVNAARASACGASLRGAVLEQAFFEGAALTGAVLDEARGEYTLFDDADLSAASLRGAALPWARFVRARLDGADLRGAKLVSARFIEATGERVLARGADLSRASFEGARVPGIELVDAHCVESIWMRAHLDGADLGFAKLARATFIEASAAGAQFFGADARDGRFYRARLERASFHGANLFSADLAKARLDGASFRRANLYDAKFIGASGAGADFLDAELARSTLERA